MGFWHSSVFPFPPFISHNLPSIEEQNQKDNFDNAFSKDYKDNKKQKELTILVKNLKRFVMFARQTMCRFAKMITKSLDQKSNLIVKLRHSEWSYVILIWRGNKFLFLCILFHLQSYISLSYFRFMKKFLQQVQNNKSILNFQSKLLKQLQSQWQKK